jgi:hemerythrin
VARDGPPQETDMTKTLAWSDRLSVGVKGIDRQHRELLGRVNALFDAIGSRDAGRNVEELLCFMEKYVHRHFLCEEKLMRRHHYPAYAQHLGQHQRFLDELARIDAQFERSGLTEAVVMGMSGYITEWLTGHFLVDDRLLAEYLKSGTARAPATELVA